MHGNGTHATLSSGRVTLGIETRGHHKVANISDASEENNDEPVP